MDNSNSLGITIPKLSFEKMIASIKNNNNLPKDIKDKIIFDLKTKKNTNLNK